MTNAEFLDLRNKLEAMEDKLDAGHRLLLRIARRLAADDADKAQTEELTRELAAAATSLETTVAATKQPA
jgi:hypothetical protein